MFFIHRDVCQNGFSDEVTGKADAVFLDLPHPHLVVPFAIKAFKPSGNFRNNIIKMLAITYIISYYLRNDLYQASTKTRYLESLNYFIVMCYTTS